MSLLLLAHRKKHFVLGAECNWYYVFWPSFGTKLRISRALHCAAGGEDVDSDQESDEEDQGQ